VLRGGKPLPKISAVKLSGNSARVPVGSSVPLKAATLNYTTDSGAWQKREWKTVPARIEGSSVSASLPPQRPLVAFLAITDERGLRVSSEHFSVEAARRNGLADRGRSWSRFEKQDR
jgi:hypothetical protein